MKFDLLKIIKVEATNDFKLLLTFSNKEKSQFDFSTFLKLPGEMIQPLKNVRYFKKVFLESGQPTWPNGFDLCPDFLYKKTSLKPKSKKTA